MIQERIEYLERDYIIRAIPKIPPDDGWRVGEYRGKRLWLIPNEVRGLTLMFPEDY